MHEKAFSWKESMQVLRKSGGYNSVVRVSVCGTESAGSIPAIRPLVFSWSCGPGAR